MATNLKAMHFDGPAVKTERLECPEFMLLNGRLPRVGDDPPPWKYRGWLLPYVQMAEMAINRENSRWAYYIEILETGELPDRPIPPLAFGPPDSRVYGQMGQWAEAVGYDMGGWSDFHSLLDWLLWSLAITKEEPRLHNPGAAERIYRTFNAETLLRTPYDYWGQFICERKSKRWNPSGFYPTPHEVVECMVRMTMFDETVDARHKTVLDPCAGTGRMLIHAAQFSLRLYGNDIDPIPLAGCLINGALYAPWLSYPLPEGIWAKEDWLKALGLEPIDDSPPPVYEGNGRYQPSFFDHAINEVESLT